MLTIRLFRVGKKNQPAYKIVVTDKRNAASRGRFVEEVGFYNPLTKLRNLKGDRVKYWISVGAKPSTTVHNMLVSDKVIEDAKIAKHKKSKKETPAENPLGDSDSAGSPTGAESAQTPVAEPAEPAEEAPAEEPAGSAAEEPEETPAETEDQAPPAEPAEEAPATEPAIEAEEQKKDAAAEPTEEKPAEEEKK
jgi:small subunit ribosomal protein S16